MIRSFLAAPLVGLAALLLAGCAADGSTGTDGPQSAFDSGYQMMVQQDYAGARDVFLGIVAEDPGNAYAHLNLGAAYEELGEIELARTHYELALQTGSDAPIAGTVEDGVVSTGVNTTVGALATQNLAKLGG